MIPSADRLRARRRRVWFILAYYCFAALALGAVVVLWLVTGMAVGQ